MADFIYNIAKGAFVEKVRDGGTACLILLLEAAEADTALADHDDLNALLGAAGNTEATATGYARKTGLTATITIDDSNDRVDVDIPDQTWNSVSGNAFTDLIVAYEESASDTGRIPLSNHDFAVTPNGGDITVQFNAAGFGRAEGAAL